MTNDQDFYRETGVYDYRRDTAFPWAIDWSVLKYKVVGRDKIIIRRKKQFEFLETSIPHLKNLPEKELQLPYEKYIVPELLLGSTNTDSLDDNYQPKTIYNPFDAFNKIPKRKRTDLPYADLFSLDVEDESAIIDFVNKHGLLGIFFHRYKNLPLVNIAEGYDENDTIKATFQFINEGVKGRNKKVELTADCGLWVGKPKDKEGLIPVSLKQINDTYFPFQFDPYDYGDFSLTYYGEIDFRLAIMDNKNPVDWWGFYCEPLPLFIKEAKMFKDISSTIHRLDELEDEVELKRYLSKIIFQLRKNLEDTHPTIKYNEDGEGKERKNLQRLVNTWEFPSLISAYYLMLYLKISENRQTQLCARERCRRPFFKGRSDNYYCSETCQANEKSQRARDTSGGKIDYELYTRDLYLPKKVKYLLVMGLPLNEEMLFQYSDTGTYTNFPFVRTVFAFYPGEYKKSNEVIANREDILKRFKEDGIFVIDAVERNRFKEHAPSTIKRKIAEYVNKETIIFLVGISDKATKYLKERGYKIIHQKPIPYPDEKEKRKKYEERLKSILNMCGYYND